nr:MAG TPA: hypothetical protein [Caudoviricetes sp.]
MAESFFCRIFLYTKITGIELPVISDCRQSPGICRDFYYEHCFSGIIKLSERRCFL